MRTLCVSAWLYVTASSVLWRDGSSFMFPLPGAVRQRGGRAKEVTALQMAKGPGRGGGGGPGKGGGKKLPGRNRRFRKNKGKGAGGYEGLVPGNFGGYGTDPISAFLQMSAMGRGIPPWIEEAGIDLDSLAAIDGLGPGLGPQSFGGHFVPLHGGRRGGRRGRKNASGIFAEDDYEVDAFMQQPARAALRARLNKELLSCSEDDNNFYWTARVPGATRSSSRASVSVVPESADEPAVVSFSTVARAVSGGQQAEMKWHRVAPIPPGVNAERMHFSFKEDAGRHGRVGVIECRFEKDSALFDRKLAEFVMQGWHARNDPSKTERQLRREAAKRRRLGISVPADEEDEDGEDDEEKDWRRDQKLRFLRDTGPGTM